nr:hypothetical protein [Tanacetum cinerariifolium]GEY88693.1 hypothetical protein [Tanacetum cinerariifolium]
MSKDKMKDRVSSLYKDDLGDLVKTFCIPLNLHPRFPNPTLTMDRIPCDAIGVYSKFLWFFNVCIPFSSFLLSVLSYFKNDIKRLCIRLIRLREMKEEVLVRFGQVLFGLIKSVIRCSRGKMITLHTNAADAEGALIPFPTSDEVVAAQSDPRPSQIETFVRAATPVCGVARKGFATSGFPEKPRSEDAQSCLDPLDTLARSPLLRDAKYDKIPDNDFATASRSEEIDLTFFPLAPCPYVIPYPFDSDSSPLYTKHQWDEPHLPKNNILYKEIFRDPDVRTLEKLKRKSRYVKDLCSEVTTLDTKLKRAQRDYSVLDQENKELHSRSDVSSEELKRLQAQLTDAKASSTIVFTSAMSTEHSLSSSINILFVSPSHYTAASLLRISFLIFFSWHMTSKVAEALNHLKDLLSILLCFLASSFI